MHHIITFKTAKFDVSKEEENPINPIYGYSLLNWLKDQIAEKAEIESPDAEDWGWYSFIEWEDRVYMLGASVFYEKGDDPKDNLEWVFQVDKQRTIKEKILGREKMRIDDSCLLYFKSIFESDPEFKKVAVE
jgi:hypothetical protein